MLRGLKKYFIFSSFLFAALLINCINQVKTTRILVTLGSHSFLTRASLGKIEATEYLKISQNQIKEFKKLKFSLDKHEKVRKKLKPSFKIARSNAQIAQEIDHRVAVAKNEAFLNEKQNEFVLKTKKIKIQKIVIDSRVALQYSPLEIGKKLLALDNKKNEHQKAIETREIGKNQKYIAELGYKSSKYLDKSYNDYSVASKITTIKKSRTVSNKNKEDSGSLLTENFNNNLLSMHGEDVVSLRSASALSIKGGLEESKARQTKDTDYLIVDSAINNLSPGYQVRTKEEGRKKEMSTHNQFRSSGYPGETPLSVGRVLAYNGYSGAVSGQTKGSNDFTHRIMYMGNNRNVESVKLYTLDNNFINAEYENGNWMIGTHERFIEVEANNQVAVTSTSSLAKEIPLFDKDFVDKNSSLIKDSDTFALFKLEKGIDDIDVINKKYRSKAYLNKYFKVIDQFESDYTYVLFIDIEPGNFVYVARTFTGENLTTVGHIFSKVMNYNEVGINKNTRINLEIEEETLYGKLKKFTIEGGMISLFSQDKDFNLEMPGEYSLRTNESLKNSKEYININSKKNKIFAGITKSKLKVPSDKFIKHLMNNEFNLGSLQNEECIIQINLSNSINNVNIVSSTGYSESIYDSIYLDQDGQMYSSISSFTNKIFILGKEESMFEIELEGHQNTKTLVTYCSPRSYVIETI